ncbi:MAG: cation transporter [Actinomycetia bacterium]|nr:cation transporter [Actinomycetes bacterium]
MTVKKDSYPLLGVECASCVKKIETVLKKQDGIIEAVVNLATENLTIEYDEDKIGLEEISEVIKKIGYEMIT